MKCPICNGKGYVYNALGSFNEDCGHCQGTGNVRVEGEPMTNEEWLRQASTEDVAKWLSKISKFFHECGKRDVYPKTMYEEDWECWLKEIHDE
mgnify:CR=1 FL=1